MSGASPPPVPLSDADWLGVSLSHDLRAPLRVIEGFAQILREDYAGQLDRRGVDHLERILGAAHRMNGMIDVLLDLAQLGTQVLSRQPVNLSDMALGILSDLHGAEPHRQVHIEVEPGLIRWGDPGLLQRLMDNLLGNAWKYTRQRESASIHFQSRPGPDGRTRFEVVDNGAGFDMRLVGQLFAPFQRLHSSSEFPGHGVGLATVKRIVERHGGQVGARAEPGVGAVFWFTLAERSADTGPRG